jgi:hypothetical protein
MLRKLWAVLKQPRTSPARDAALGSKFFYLASVLVFALGTLKVAHLGLTEAQLLLGLLLVICVTLQMIVMAMLLEVRGRLPSTAESHR